MNEHEKSDRPVVPVKLPNNAARAVAEVVEGRGLREGNAVGKTRPGLRAGVDGLSALDRVRRIAKEDKDAKFTALLHHVNVERLRSAYLALRPKAAAGVDGVTWHEYGLGLEENLRGLHRRVHCGSYRAKPVKRAYIPKRDGGMRPLGVAALEDKILQRALVEVLNAIYEADFLGFSYGFRPGRSPHQALDALAVAIQHRKVSWILDADIRGYFEHIDRSWMTRFLEHRIGDRRVLRLVQKWMSAGVIENGERVDRLEGTPQGASVTAPTQKVTWVARACGGGDRVADSDLVVVASDQDLADDEPQDALLFVKVELVETGVEAAEESVEGVGELEVGLGVVELCLERVELGAERGLSLAQRGHASAQLVDREELFLVGLDQAVDRALRAGDVALERIAAAAGGVLGPQGLEAAVDLRAHERGVFEQPADLVPHEPVELIGADRAAVAHAPADVAVVV